MKLEIDTERDGVEHLEHLAHMLLSMAGKKLESSQSQVFQSQPESIQQRVRPRDIMRQQDQSQPRYEQSYSQIHTPQQVRPASDNFQQQPQATSTPLFNMFDSAPQRPTVNSHVSQSAQPASTVRSTESIFNLFTDSEHSQPKQCDDDVLDDLRIIPY